MPVMNQRNDIHVVIVNFRSATHVQNCIRSLADSPISSIVVVDNNSGPRHLDELRMRTAEFANVSIISNPINRGFGHGVNVGAASIKLQYLDRLWVLNPDTIVRPGCAEALLQATKSGLDIASPLITKGDPTEEMIWFAGGDVDLRTMTTPHYHHGDPIAMADELPKVLQSRFLTGTAPFFTSEAWHRLGGFREDLFMYWEDADLSVRAQHLRLRMAVVTRARVWHAVGATSGESGLSPLYYRHMQRNRIRLAREWGVTRTVFIGPGVRQTTKLLVDPLLEPRNKIRSAWSSFRGLLSGISTAHKENTITAENSP